MAVDIFSSRKIGNSIQHGSLNTDQLRRQADQTQ